jgi:hypothetical protein
MFGYTGGYQTKDAGCHFRRVGTRRSKILFIDCDILGLAHNVTLLGSLKHDNVTFKRLVLNFQA